MILKYSRLCDGMGISCIKLLTKICTGCIQIYNFFSDAVLFCIYLYFKALHWELDPVFVDKSFILLSWIIQVLCQASLYPVSEKEILKSYTIIFLNKNQSLFLNNFTLVKLYVFWWLNILYCWNKHHNLQSIWFIESILNELTFSCYWSTPKEYGSIRNV